MAKSGASSERLRRRDEGLVNAVHRMEPELYHLEGILATLGLFGEAGDSVEPAALAALARSMEGSVAELTACWRQVFEAVATGATKELPA